MNKKLGIGGALLMAGALIAGIAMASPKHHEGAINGMVFQSGYDIDGDGSNGRGGTLWVHGSTFKRFQTHVDSWVDLNDPFQSCDPGVFRLFVAGDVALQSNNGENALLGRIDEQSYCLDGSTESVTITIEQGTGLFEGATGNGTVSLPDDRVLSVNPVNGIPFPSVVYVNNGSFSLDLD